MKSINPELQYRLDFLRFCDRRVIEAEKAQQHLSTSAWSKAAVWIHEVLINKAAESIKEFVPLHGSQDTALADFVRSIEQTKPKPK